MEKELWSDCKRVVFFGLPLSFTKYRLTTNRLFVNTGFLTQREDEVRLYRITDVSLSRTLMQRVFGLSTIHCNSSDKTLGNFDIINIKDGEEVIGKQTKVKVVKNKVAPPFRKAEFDIMFGEGISRAGEIIDLGADLGIIKKSGSWYSYNETKLGQGRDASKQVIQDNPELAEELEGLIFAALKEQE